MRTLQRTIAFPGGIAPVHAVRTVAELAMSHGDGSLHIDSAQRITVTGLPAEFGETVDRRLSGLLATSTEEPFVTSTAPFCGMAKGTPWITEGQFAAAIASIGPKPDVSIALSDPRQPFAPICTGVVNFIATQTPGRWAVAVAREGMQWTILPHAVSTDALGAAARAIAPHRNDDAMLTGALAAAGPHAVGAEVDLTGNDAYDDHLGFCPVNNNFTLGIGATQLSAAFLVDLCILAARCAIHSFGLTTWRSLLIHGIGAKDVNAFRRVLARHRVPVCRPDAETLWLSAGHHLPVGEWTSELARLCPSTANLSFGLVSDAMPCPDTSVLIRADGNGRYCDVWARDKYLPRSNPIHPVASRIHKSKLPQVLRDIVMSACQGDAIAPTPEATIAQPVYHCVHCLTEYCETLGDAANSVPPNTPLDALPATWVCPVCHAPASAYTRVAGF